MKPIVCIFCNREMRGATKRHWIIQRETGAILGQSHKKCWDIVRFKEDCLYLGVHEDEIYGRPSEDEIAFAQKMADINDGLKDVPFMELNALEKRVRILSLYQWPYSSIQEFLEDERHVKLMNHWIFGSKIMTPEGVQAVKDYFLEAFQEES